MRESIINSLSIQLASALCSHPNSDPYVSIAMHRELSESLGGVYSSITSIGDHKLVSRSMHVPMLISFCRFMSAVGLTIQNRTCYSKSSLD